MGLQKVYEHELKIKNKLKNKVFTLEELWKAFSFVLLNRPQFSEFFQNIEILNTVQDEIKTTAKVSLELQGSQVIEEEIEFYPEKKILTKILGTKDYPTSSVEVDFVAEDDDSFTLRFIYGEDLQMKKEIGLQMSDEMEQIRRQTWKMKDAEIVAGALEILVKEKQ